MGIDEIVDKTGVDEMGSRRSGTPPFIHVLFSSAII